MGPRIIFFRTAIRGFLALSAISALVVGLHLLLTEMNTVNPNAALTALLGSVIGGLGSFLVIMGQAIAHNPSDRGD